MISSVVVLLLFLKWDHIILENDSFSPFINIRNLLCFYIHSSMMIFIFFEEYRTIKLNLLIVSIFSLFSFCIHSYISLNLSFSDEIIFGKMVFLSIFLFLFPLTFCKNFNIKRILLFISSFLLFTFLGFVLNIVMFIDDYFVKQRVFEFDVNFTSALSIHILIVASILNSIWR